MRLLLLQRSISRLAKEYLESDFVFYKKSQIKQLDRKAENLVKLDKKTIKIKNETETGKIKLRVAKKIETTKTELKKLQELYSSPEKLPAEIKLKVAKKIGAKKDELKKLYNDPRSFIKSPKMRKWVGLQVVKIFLGVPIVPGK